MNHHYKSLLGLLGGEIRQSLAWPGKPCRLEHHKNHHHHAPAATDRYRLHLDIPSVIRPVHSTIFKF